ncbi:MAG: amidohydrolase family protein [Acidimicrobiia bacterium]|nr:amidohydrolase family protein [Acidimicrobiia bacterium]
MSSLLFRNVEVGGHNVDVRVTGDTIAAVGHDLDIDGADVVDGRGGALIPGLHDHHVHLLAMAAARRSVDLTGLTDVEGIGSALQRAAATNSTARWLRATGWHEPELDRETLDRLVPDRPVRVQHRSGALWVLNSRALEAAGFDEPTGRLFGMDDALRERIPPDEPLDVAAVGQRFLSFGVTGVTDASPTDRPEDIELLAESGLHVLAMSAPTLNFEGAGPAKLILADHALPGLDEVLDAIRTAHGDGRPIAVHCVTAAALVLALAAWDEAGASTGDRIEHGSVIPPELIPTIAAHGLTVVTQPNFVGERGDDYLADVDAHDIPSLYRCRSLLDGGVDVGFGTDAPFGDPDPWLAIKAATNRRTTAGAIVGAGERVDAATALDKFLGDPRRPGGPPRRVEEGAPADLVLLEAPLADVLAEPSAERVRATVSRSSGVAWRP